MIFSTDCTTAVEVLLLFWHVELSMEQVFISLVQFVLHNVTVYALALDAKVLKVHWVCRYLFKDSSRYRQHTEGMKKAREEGGGSVPRPAYSGYTLPHSGHLDALVKYVAYSGCLLFGCAWWMHNSMLFMPAGGSTKPMLLDPLACTGSSCVI
jgi:hypothetical protein